MKPVEIVKQFMEAMENGDRVRLDELATDDFAMVGLTPLAMTKWQFLEVQRALMSAFPNLSYNARDIREEGGVVKATVHLTGTQADDLVLPVPDLPAVPRTGKEISLPEATYLFGVRGTKVGEIQVQIAPGGGFQGLYSQLGARLPLPSVIPG